MRGVFSCTCPGDERPAILEPPLNTGAGGGSPVYLAWQGGQITRASVWGPDAAKPQMDHRFGMARDLSERREAVCSLHRLTGTVINMGGNVAILSAAACRAGTRKAHDFTGGATWCSCQTVTHARNGYPSVMAVVACTRTCSECHGHPIPQSAHATSTGHWMPTTSSTSASMTKSWLTQSTG